MPSPSETGDFRARICEVALRLFAERGYTGVTLRSLAQELGCSPMTPYRYFRNKEEIFAAVRAAAYRNFAEEQLRALAVSGDPVSQIFAVGEAYLRFAVERPNDYRMMFELDQPDPTGYPEVSEAQELSFQPVRSAVAEAIDAGVLEGDVETVAHILWAGVHGLSSLALAHKLTLNRSMEELVEPMLLALFRGNQRRESSE